MSAAVLRCEGKPDEIVLIEIQSSVTMEDGSPLAGNNFGVLEINGGKVTMTNGPRTLIGKMQDLKNPLVLMHRTGRTEYVEGDPDRPEELFTAHGVVRRKAVFSGRPQLSIEK
mmetsp:Transcript_58676/g.102717  ORF Transcript_58676/g.102717 Transcript_58676/m.102717 type:complete len:113 (+) Transcript_58676:39-377(+)